MAGNLRAGFQCTNAEKDHLSIHDLNHIAKALHISITEIIDACVTGKASPVVNINQLAIPLSNLNVSAGNGLLVDNEFTYDKFIVDKEWFL